jgi:leucyl-tRNA synthetase
MVTHETYQAADVSSGSNDVRHYWVATDEVERTPEGLREKGTGRPIHIGRVEKMSKSKKNTVDPTGIVDQYGADAVRWFMLSDSPPERDLPWSEAGIEGCWRFTQRLWRLFDGLQDSAKEQAGGEDKALDRKTHQTIAGVAADIEALSFNKAVAKLYELVNAIERASPSASRTAAIRTLMRLAAPMAPHLAEEAWAANGGEGLIADATWPEVDPALLVEDEVTIAIQVNGKLRDTVTVAKGTGREAIETIALANANVQRILEGAAPKKVIVVPDRLVNIVA